MKANRLKGLLTSCHDKTDLPTPAMLEAGAKALAFFLEDGDFSDREIAREIWTAMLDALHGEGNPPSLETEEA